MLFLMDLVELPAHETLDRKNCVLRIRHRLTFRGLADQSLAIFCKCNHRGRRARAFAIFQNYRVATFHHGHAGIGGAQIDT